MLKNDYLPFDQLPRADTLPFEMFPRRSLFCDSLDKLTLWLIVLCAGIGAFVMQPELMLRAGSLWFWLVPLALVNIAWPLLSWHYRRFALREHDVLLQEGVIFRRQSAQSLARVQHVKLHQGPLQRLFGLATLVLCTAGKDGADCKLRHLPLARAEDLRNHILRAALQTAPAATVAPAAPAAAPVPGAAAPVESAASAAT